VWISKKATQRAAKEEREAKKTGKGKKLTRKVELGTARVESWRQYLAGLLMSI
jgi:hypothetical protein